MPNFNDKVRKLPSYESYFEKIFLFNFTKLLISLETKTFMHGVEDWGFPQFIKLETLLSSDAGTYIFYMIYSLIYSLSLY